MYIGQQLAIGINKSVFLMVENKNITKIKMLTNLTVYICKGQNHLKNLNQNVFYLIHFHIILLREK